MFILTTRFIIYNWLGLHFTIYVSNKFSSRMGWWEKFSLCFSMVVNGINFSAKMGSLYSELYSTVERGVIIARHAAEKKQFSVQTSYGRKLAFCFRYEKAHHFYFYLVHQFLTVLFMSKVFDKLFFKVEGYHFWIALSCSWLRDSLHPYALNDCLL